MSIIESLSGIKPDQFSRKIKISAHDGIVFNFEKFAANSGFDSLLVFVGNINCFIVINGNDIRFLYWFHNDVIVQVDVIGDDVGVDLLVESVPNIKKVVGSRWFLR